MKSFLLNRTFRTSRSLRTRNFYKFLAAMQLQGFAVNERERNLNIELSIRNNKIRGLEDEVKLTIMGNNYS